MVEDGSDNEEYDMEEQSHEFSEYGDEALEVESIYFLSQQPHEVHDIVLHPTNIDLVEYLNETHNIRFMGGRRQRYSTSTPAVVRSD